VGLSNEPEREPSAEMADSQATGSDHTPLSATSASGFTISRTDTSDSSENYLSLITRFGMSGSTDDIESALAAGLSFGSFFNWGIISRPFTFPGIMFWQTVRVSQRGIETDWTQMAAAAEANPGSIWQVGNEPDVVWQDNVTPERYAVIYHDAYTFIKSHDPTAQIAIGPISVLTPLRQAYLDIVLDTYQATYGHSMPIDVWNVHAYILREENDSWGVGMPPGMGGESGLLYEIEDHGDIEIFRQNILEFRAWMADRGFTERPLAVTEFGVLMPADYGFPPEDNGLFMQEALEFMLTAANETGYPQDGGRLVQWWFWYSLYDTVGYYDVSNLYDRETGFLTYLGETWVRFLRDRQ
jgi:hypothetical protein